MTKRLLAMILCLVTLCALLPATALPAEAKTAISVVEATSPDLAALSVYGTGAGESPTFTVTKGAPAFFEVLSTGFWQYYFNGSWLTMYRGTISSGTWRYRCQIRIEGDGAQNYNYGGSLTVKVNGASWWHGNTVNEDGYSFVWVTSPEFTVTAPASAPLSIASIPDIPKSKVGEAINTIPVRDRTDGGKKPYTFSKASGPDWLKVSSDGVVSGTPIVGGDNADLVIRVTDARGDHAETTVKVGTSVSEPGYRAPIDTVEANVPDLYDHLVSGGGSAPNVTFTVTKGAPAFFDILHTGLWEYYEDGRWNKRYQGELFPGKWRLSCQIRIEGDAAQNYKLTDNMTVKVNGVAWEASPAVVEETYSFAWVYSPAVEIGEIAGGEGWRIDTNGCLHIFGAVKNPSTSTDRTPWKAYKEQIHSVVTGLHGSVDNAACLFMNCVNLSEADLKKLDTSKATSAYLMFSGCKSLKELDLRGLDTSKVKIFRSMFSGCEKLEVLDLYKVSADSLENASRMFYDCGSLKEIHAHAAILNATADQLLAISDAWEDTTRGRTYHSEEDFRRNLLGYASLLKAGNPPVVGLKGDVNGDGVVNAFDYQMVKAYVLGTFPGATSAQIAAMDVNGDGIVNAFDYQMLKAAVLGTYHFS